MFKKLTKCNSTYGTQSTCSRMSNRSQLSQCQTRTDYSDKYCASMPNLPPQTNTSQPRRTISMRYGLICNNCSNMENASKKTFQPYFTNMEKEKLWTQFERTNPLYFQDKMERSRHNTIQNKVNSRMCNADLAVNRLKDYRISETTEKEKLQLSNEFSLYNGLTGEKDPRYNRVKSNYDRRQNRLYSSDCKNYSIDRPRKAVRDYYEKCVFQVPLQEPSSRPSKVYTDNVNKYLLLQMKEKKLKEKIGKDKEQRNNKRANWDFDQHNNEINQKYDYDKLRLHRKIYGENQGLINFKNKINKNNEIKEKQLKEDYKQKFRKDNEAHQNRLKENKLLIKESIGQFLRQRYSDYAKRKVENDNDRIKTDKYNREYQQKCHHGNNMLRCCLCNKLFTKNRLGSYAV